MLTNIFNNTVTNLDITSLLISFVVSLICGIVIALTHKYTAKYTKGYLVTISILPILVSIIIILVNGNLGAGIAIAGAFSLVRFRSLPGTSKEIATVFFAMTIGLTIGSGFIFVALLLTVIGSLALIIFDKIKIFDLNQNEKMLRIVIPEELDYTDVFDDTFKKYTKKVELTRVKLIDMGSMFELKYLITLKNIKDEKEFIDELRVKNGNLKITLSQGIEEGEL